MLRRETPDPRPAALFTKGGRDPFACLAQGAFHSGRHVGDDHRTAVHLHRVEKRPQSDLGDEGARISLTFRNIGTFWDPRTRRGLEALVAEGSDDLDPLLVDAAGRLATHATRSDPEAQP